MSSPAKSAVDRTGPDLLSREYWNGTIKMSLSKYFILGVLHRRPMHGYEIAREVQRFTRGCCSPTEGTIYPVLRQYEQGGYVTCRSQVVSGRTRRVYTLTRRGVRAFKVAMEAWMEVTEALSGSAALAASGRRESGSKP